MVAAPGWFAGSVDPGGAPADVDGGEAGDAVGAEAADADGVVVTTVLAESFADSAPLSCSGSSLQAVTTTDQHEAGNQSRVHRLTRIRPSCTTFTTRSPPAVKIDPPAKPRADELEMARCSYNNHSSARNRR